MKTLIIMGDPGSISLTLSKIHADNPKMKVISTCVAPYVVMPNQTNIAIPGQKTAVQPHVFYLTFDGPELVDEKGEPLKYQ